MKTLVVGYHEPTNSLGILLDMEARQSHSLDDQLSQKQIGKKYPNPIVVNAVPVYNAQGNEASFMNSGLRNGGRVQRRTDEDLSRKDGYKIRTLSDIREHNGIPSESDSTMIMEVGQHGQLG